VLVVIYSDFHALSVSLCYPILFHDENDSDRPNAFEMVKMDC